MATSAVKVDVSGRTYTFVGTGFDPGEQVLAQVKSDTVNLPVQVADPSGTVTFIWTVPDGFPAGTHQILMTAASGTASAEFTVPSSSSGGTNAPTGGTSANTLSLLALAALFMLAGLAILAVRFFRTRT